MNTINENTTQMFMQNHHLALFQWAMLANSMYCGAFSRFKWIRRKLSPILVSIFFIFRLVYLSPEQLQNDFENYLKSLQNRDVYHAILGQKRNSK